MPSIAPARKRSPGRHRRENGFSKAAGTGRGERAPQDVLEPAPGKGRHRAPRTSPKEATRALVGGALVDGPKRTAHSLRTQPKRFALGAASMVLLGSAMQAVGIDPTWAMVGLSSGAVAFDMGMNARTMRNARGAERWRSIGENAAWPVLFSGSFFGAGAVLEPHHSVPVDWNNDPGGTALHVGQAGVQSGVLAFDAPALVTTALDHSKGDHAAPEVREATPTADGEPARPPPA